MEKLKPYFNLCILDDKENVMITCLNCIRIDVTLPGKKYYNRIILPRKRKIKPSTMPVSERSDFAYKLLQEYNLNDTNFELCIEGTCKQDYYVKNLSYKFKNLKL